MTFQGIAPTLAAALALLGSAGALTLHFLRVRYPELRIPGIMLWEEALQRPLRRKLFGRLSRWLSLLTALLFIACLAGALAEPVPAPTGNRIVIVAPVAQAEAANALARRFPPADSMVLLADASPVLPHRTGKSGKARGHEPFTALVLAAEIAGADGKILYLGEDAPPFLPGKIFHIPVSGPEDFMTTAPEKSSIDIPRLSPELARLIGDSALLRNAASAAEADIVLPDSDNPAAVADILDKLEAAEISLNRTQSAEEAKRYNGETNPAFPYFYLLAAGAVLFALTDLILYSRGKNA